EALAAAGDTTDQAAPGVAATATEPEPAAGEAAQAPEPGSAAAAAPGPGDGTRPGADGNGERDPGPAAASAPAAAAQASAIPAEETLAGRIKIDADRAKPVVSGTDYERDPPELRKALRDHHFGWRKEQHHWEYAGQRSERTRHVTAIRETIARLDAEAFKPLTGQQQEICDAAVAGDHLLVQALAGTGKTTTLTAAARAIAAARPN